MPKKKPHSEKDSSIDIGRVMVVSLFLILLTFFILLNSIAVIDEKRVRAALGSLVGAFGGLPGGLSALDTGSNLMPPSAPMIEKDLEVQELISQMEASLARKITVHNIKHGEIITIDAKALFLKHSLRINPLLIPFLKKLSRSINQKEYPLEIAGHTDNRPGSEKGYASNWELSALMAVQLLKFFESQGAVRSGRLAAYGYGSRQPIAPNDSHASRAQNRRVDVILRYKAPAYIKRLYQKKSSGFFTYKRFDFKLY